MRDVPAVRRRPSVAGCREPGGTGLLPLARGGKHFGSAERWSMNMAILFATREGQTRRIAERIAADVRAAGAAVDLIDLNVAGAVELSKYDAACVASSVHVGKHERAVVQFVTRRRQELERLAAAF